MSEDSKPGFIAIFRKIQDHWIWDDADRFRAWIDILISAQFHDSKVYIDGKLITVPRGSWFISQKSLETRWGWSKTKIRYFIRTLIEQGMITTEGTPRGTIITVVNYEVYQNPSTAKNTAKDTTESTAKDTAENTSGDTSEGTHTNKGNKGNKVNKKKKTAPPSGWTFSEEEIQKMLREDPNNEEYFRAALKKRDEEGGS